MGISPSPATILLQTATIASASLYGLNNSCGGSASAGALAGGSSVGGLSGSAGAAAGGGASDASTAYEIFGA
jgi:uncharacterized membrane protein YgcG